MTTASTNTDTLFQTSTLSALQAGVYDGEMTIGQLKHYGDFGLGTFSALAGEMVLADGEAYRVDDQGVVHVVGDTTTTPFATVTFFERDETTALHSAFTCAQLQSYLDARLPLHSIPYALRVAGDFSSLTVRSVAAQQKPYPPLADALADQVVFKKQNISGSMIGFRLPAYLAGANVAGYHFHFISDDKQVGGHVLDCTTGAVTVTADDIAGLQVNLPQQAAFDPSPPGDLAGQSDVEPLVVFGAYGTSVEEPWNQAIHRALLAAGKAGDIRYSYVDQIGFTGDIDQVLRTAIAERAPAIIVGDTFGNEATVAAVAQEHPEIAFVFGSDEGPRAPNLSVFDSWTQEASYLAGMVAGGLTQSNVVGVVAGHPEGSVNRVVNAFVAGAHAISPDIEIRTTFINSWFDPEAAAATAQAQIAAGADVIFGERTGVIEAAAAAGVYAIGNMIDQSGDAPTTVVSSVVWNMQPTIAYVIDQVRNGSYTAQDLVDFSTLAVGGAQLAPLNQKVTGGIPEKLAAQIEAKAAEIAAGRFTVPVDDGEPPASTAAIVLGALYNLSGTQSGLDIPAAQGAQLAVDEVNRAGGVLGRPVQMVVADGESDPAVLAGKTTELLAQYSNVTAFLGLSDTDMVLGAAPVAAAAQRLFLTSGATSPQLPEQLPGYLFLACFGDNVQAAAAAEWAYDALSARRAAILYDAAMLYTQGLEHYFATRFTELGGEIISTQRYTTGDHTSLRLAVDNLAAADIIFVAAGPEDAPEAARLLRTEGFTAPILGGDGFDIGAHWQGYTELDNIYFTTHAYLGADNPNPTVQAFRNVYLASHPDREPDAFTALGYDAANLLLTAITTAQSAEPEAVRAALATIQAFDGVTGRISFTPGNAIPHKSVTILAVAGGNYRYVTELPPASVPAPATLPTADPTLIKIGVLNPISGPLASFGQNVNLGVELFFQSIGSEIAGRPIELVFGDTAGDAGQAVSAAQQLADDEDVDLLIGLVNSSVAGPVAGFADERQIPLVITIAGAAEVTGPARSPYVFRTAMSNGQQERPLANYLATERGLRRAATIAWDFPAGAERSAAFASAFTDTGGMIVNELQPPLGTDDFGSYLDALDPDAIDVLYIFLTGPQAPSFVRQLRQRDGFADLLLVGPGYLAAGAPPQMGDDAPPLILASEYTSAIDSPEHDQVMQWLLGDAAGLLPSYEAKVRAAADVYVMEGYLGASVVAQALAAVDGDIDDSVRFRQALAAVDFPSVSGPFRFDAHGQAVRNLYITQLIVAQNGNVLPDLLAIIANVAQR